MSYSFRGTRDPSGLGCVVEVLHHGRVEGRLAPRHDLRDHSPDGFEWGYGGSGPAQLALALASWFLSDKLALAVYQDLKWAFVGHLPHEGWERTAAEVAGHLRTCMVRDGRFRKVVQRRARR